MKADKWRSNERQRVGLISEIVNLTKNHSQKNCMVPPYITFKFVFSIWFPDSLIWSWFLPSRKLKKLYDECFTCMFSSVIQSMGFNFLSWERTSSWAPDLSFSQYTPTIYQPVWKHKHLSDQVELQKIKNRNSAQGTMVIVSEKECTRQALVAI